MAVKFTLQGALIYLAMGAYLLSAVLAWTHRDRWGRRLHGIGFLAAAAAIAVRWVESGHVPMQNMYEIFVVMGALSWPIAMFCRRFLAVGGYGADAMVGALLLFPAGFVFSAEPRLLPPALQSWLFAPHVTSYLLAYMILAKASVQAAGRLFVGDSPVAAGEVGREVAAYRLVCLGFPLLTAGLLLGAVWGKLAWGDWWNWDPKELWSLVSWLAFVFYFHFRAVYGVRRPRANAAIVLVAMGAILITLLWVNLSRIFAGLHSYAA